MQWLQHIDTAGFRFVNQSLCNPVFDWLMPFLSGNRWFGPGLVLVAIWLVWKGGLRGRVCLALLMVGVLVNDVVVVNGIKQAIGRPRPYQTLTDARVLVGQTANPSMPSGHAANWFAALAIAGSFYRRLRPGLAVVAVGVSVSRIYNGVHYPSDVLVGALVGASCGAGTVAGARAAWSFAGQRWFPLWWRRIPMITAPEPNAAAPAPEHAELDRYLLRLGYLLIGALLVARWAYIASGSIQLSEDEAYQWLWSKHLALSYYSKPPMIAYAQRLGTALWGDNAFGVRFLAPLIAAGLATLLLRFMAREAGVRVAFGLLAATLSCPLIAVGAVLLTIDPLSVLFWTAAMLSGWRALQRDATTDWLWTGLWMGLGFLSKYVAVLQWASWVLVFVFFPSARRQLRRPGPYLALLVNAVLALPVLIWNAQHGWITAVHLGERGGLGDPWQPTLRFLWEFLGAQAGLLNPLFAVAIVWAAVAVWRRGRPRPLALYLWCMGVPLFGFYTLYTLRGRVLPNWIAPSVLPLLALAAVYWEERWRLGARWVRPVALTGWTLGLVVVVLAHESNLVSKLTGQALPPAIDPLRRVRGWSEMARLAGQVRAELLAEGKPVFVIGDHYGTTALVSFYLPEARAEAGSKTPLVYYRSSLKPENQFFFWPGYRERRGENAIYIAQVAKAGAAPARLRDQFESVADLGLREVTYRGRVLRRIQLFACRHLL